MDEAFRGPAWHGPSLRQALQGVTAEAALWRPAPGRNSIWDLVLHAAYTKHRVLGRLTRRRAVFPRPLPRSWWPAASERMDEAAWERDRALLDECHRAIVEAVRIAPAAALSRGSPRPLAEQLAGLALHDVYHGGQVSLLRKLYEQRHAASA